MKATDLIKQTSARLGLTFASVVVAGIAGWSLGIVAALVAANASLGWFIACALGAGGLAAGSFWLAHRSRVPLRWMSWPLLAGGAIGFVGFWFWIMSTIEWE